MGRRKLVGARTFCLTLSSGLLTRIIRVTKDRKLLVALFAGVLVLGALLLQAPLQLGGISMSQSSRPDPTADTLLVEVIFQRAQTSPTGIRVYGDGRYELLSDQKSTGDTSGNTTHQKAPLAWHTQYTLSTAEHAYTNGA